MCIRRNFVPKLPGITYHAHLLAGDGGVNEMQCLKSPDKPLHSHILTKAEDYSPVWGRAPTTCILEVSGTIYLPNSFMWPLLSCTEL